MIVWDSGVAFIYWGQRTGKEQLSDIMGLLHAKLLLLAERIRLVCLFVLLHISFLTLKVLVTTTDAQWEGMGM